MALIPNTLVLRAPGTNCDVETAFAFEKAGSRTESLHINALVEAPQRLRDFQILCFPGGFSYGDDIAAGRVLATQVMQRLADPLREFIDEGKLILGICNGFQILLKAGLLLPRDEQGVPATLTWNDNGRFMDRWVHLQGDGERCVFLRGIDRIYLPIAHAEGKFVVRDTSLLEQLEAQHQLALRYCNGEPTDGSGGNPNGSQANVAGICDETGRVFGLMPHPERHLDPTHHPQWTRAGGDLPEHGEGLALFRNAVDYFV